MKVLNVPIITQDICEAELDTVTSSFTEYVFGFAEQANFLGTLARLCNAKLDEFNFGIT